LADEYPYLHACPQDTSALTRDGIAEEVFPGSPSPPAPPPGNDPKELNVTTVTVVGDIKWRDLILTPDISPLPKLPNLDPKTCNLAPPPSSLLLPFLVINSNDS